MAMTELRIKREVRVIGIDDAPFDRRKGDRSTIIIGAFFRGGHFLDGITSTAAGIDGDDSTGKIAQMILRSKFMPQLKCIMLNGISVGGFNIIDVQELNSRTGLPVISVVRDYPDFRKIESALTKIGMRGKIGIMRKAGPVHPIGSIYAQVTGTSLKRAAEIIRMTTTRSNIPEPIRVSHIIASGLVFGESRGKA